MTPPPCRGPSLSRTRPPWCWAGGARVSALSSSALSEREASRLDKFKHLLAGPNTDLGESLWVVPGVGPHG